MRKIAVIALCFSALFVAGAQKKMKPWTEWTEKEARKILDDSPWGQTQTESDTSEMFYSPTNRGGTATGGGANQGSLNQSTNINFRIRFLSARPVRQAFARLIELGQKTPNPQVSERLREFAEHRTTDYIVIAVTFDSRDGRFSAPAMQAFNSANLGTLKNNTFLEQKDGRRLFISDYKPPINDGMGAKFVFPRLENGEPFITLKSGEVRFNSEVSKDIRLNLRFKVAPMIYEGELEY